MIEGLRSAFIGLASRRKIVKPHPDVESRFGRLFPLIIRREFGNQFFVCYAVFIRVGSLYEVADRFDEGFPDFV